MVKLGQSSDYPEHNKVLFQKNAMFRLKSSNREVVIFSIMQNEIREKRGVDMQYYIFKKRKKKMIKIMGELQKIHELVGKDGNIFHKFQPDHEIKKLKLHTLTLEDVCQRIDKFQIRPKLTLQDHTKNWMENQYRIFIWFLFIISELTSIHPKNYSISEWEIISETFNKSPSQCKYFYRCCVKERSSRWTEEEDQFIQQMMKNPKFEKKWTEIGLELFHHSNQLFFKKPKMIRERWLSHLNPEITKKDWTLEQDLLLFENIEEQGKRWSKISKLLKNKSEHSVKNRFKKIIHQRCKNLKVSQAQIPQELEFELIREEKIEIKKRILSKSIHETNNLPSQFRKNQEQLTHEQNHQIEPSPKKHYFQPIILTTSSIL